MRASLNGRLVEANGAKLIAAVAAVFALALLLVGGLMFGISTSHANGPKVKVTVESCSAETQTRHDSDGSHTTTAWECTGSWVLNGETHRGPVDGAASNVSGRTKTAHVSGGVAYLNTGVVRWVGFVLLCVGAVAAVIAVVAFMKGRGRPFVRRAPTQERGDVVISDFGGWEQT